MSKPDNQLEVADEPLDETTRDRICKQVEFYFSDSNLPRDKFLLDRVHAHPEGYVDAALICAFSRMAAILNLKPNTKPEEVPNAFIKKTAQALRSSKELLVSESGAQIKRATPLQSQDDIVRQIDERSIFSSPLPFDATLDDLTNFFAELGSLRSVRMRRHIISKEFVGSVFVEFDSKETAEEAVRRSSEGTPILYQGAPQSMILKTSYLASKGKSNTGKSAKGALWAEELVKPDADIASANPGWEMGSPHLKRKWEGDDASAHPKSKAKTEATPTDASPQSFTPGLVLKIELDGDVPDQLNFKALKDSLGGKGAGIAYVELPKGSNVGFLRAFKTDDITAFLAKKGEDDSITVTVEGRDVKLKLSKIEGEEEESFHKRAAEARALSEKNKPGGGELHINKNNYRRNFGYGSGRGRRGRGGRFGRSGRVV